MCLVSFVPIAHDHYVLTSNRDEHPERNAQNILNETITSHKVFYPADKLGGSWIFGSDQRQLLCILNGAFQNHKRNPPYRASRGIILKSFFNYNNIANFVEPLDLSDIEPFTAILFAKDQLVELRWDESIMHLRRLNPQQSHIWSSCTLYDDQQIENRKSKFLELLGKQKLSPRAVRNIHAYVDPNLSDHSNSFIMNREERVKTLSITQIEIDKEKVKLSHKDLIAENQQTLDVI